MTTANAQLEGEFQLVVRSPRGDRTYKAPNIITNAGLDRLMGGLGVFGSGAYFVQVGTGAATPAATDTALQNRVASTSDVQDAINTGGFYTAGPPDYLTFPCTYRFALGAINTAVSGNLAEVGIGWASTGSLWSRALITDSGGTPTTLQVLADEQLDVTYICRVYPQTADSTGSIVLDGVTYSYTLRPCSVSTLDSFGNQGWSGSLFVAGFTGGATSGATYNDTIKVRTSGPSANPGSGAVAKTFSSYSNGSYQRTIFNTYDLTTHNIAGGIKSVVVNAFSTYALFAHQIEFSPNIPKDATKRLRLDVQYTFARRP